jgi:hypothetical protein
MSRRSVLSIGLIFLALSPECSCIWDLGPQDKRILLEYQFTQGWTGIVTSIVISEDYLAIGYSTDSTFAVQFNHRDMGALDRLLAEFSSFKRYYHLQGRIWYDIPTHSLIHHSYARSDTVTILEPLDSPDIPAVLRNGVTTLESKL